MEKYNINFNYEDIPKYMHIVKYIKNMIDKNIIEDGEKLPPIRMLSQHLNVNNVTVVNAYKRLENEGYAVQKIGSGTYAKRKYNSKSFRKEYSETFKKLDADVRKEYIDFTGETTCSDFFPVSIFKEVLDEVLDRDGVDALIYQDTLGYTGLRESINNYFWGNNLKTESILIVSGAQQGIDVVAKALIGINDNVIVEKPTYAGALSVFKWRRANIFEVDMLQDGVDINKFEKILKKNKIKCFYAMSYFQNPTTMTYSLEKKMQILRLADIYDFYIIEDDYLSELIYDDNMNYQSFKSLDVNDRVIYIKSFSKIFLPGIRIGYLICPFEFMESIQNSKINTDISTSSLMQRALDLYINKGLWIKYIQNLNNFYKNRYIYTLQQLKNKLSKVAQYSCPRGGLNFYIKIGDNASLNSIELFYKCLSEKVLITPGVLFYKNPKEGSQYFRLSFSQTNEIEINKGISIIYDILSASKVSD